MPVQNVYLDWATWINGLDIGGPTHGSESTMKVGGHTWSSQTADARPLFKLNSDAFSGQILSATLNLYCTEGRSTIMAYRIIRASNANATWRSSGLSDWGWDGASQPNTDYSQTPLFSAWYGMSTVGWHAIPIVAMTELEAIISGIYTFIIHANSTNYNAFISKINIPYLAVTYKSSLVGGVQII